MILNDVAALLGQVFVVALIFLTALELRRYFKTAFEPNTAETHAAPASLPRMGSETLAAFVLSRAAILAMVALLLYLEDGSLSSYWPRLARLLRRWDAGNYIKLAQNGYVTEGDDALLIVFLPLYPMLARLFVLCGADAFRTLAAISNVSLLGAGLLLYRTCALREGNDRGRRAMLLLMFCPVSFFFSMPFSESLFLLLTIGAVALARAGRFREAVLLGALTACTRVVGLAVAIPIYWEMLRQSDAPPLRRILVCALRVLPVAMGFLAYLGLNAKLFSDPLRFLTFQRENWNQRLASPANTLRYTLVNVLTYSKLYYRLGTWGPQLVTMIGVPALIAARRRAHEPGETGYALVYHAISYAPTWLLSGVRYTAGMACLYPMLARVPRSRRGFVALFLSEFLLLLYMTWVGLWKGFAL